MGSANRIGRYQLRSRIGRGGMAEVFVATHAGAAGFERPVCIKKILSHFTADQEFRDLFVREARVVGQLVHSNIVQVFDCIEDGADLAIVMELVEGLDLRDLLVQLRRLGQEMSPQLVAYIAGQMLAALRAAHRQRIVHRDVSPHNILISREGEVKLADFGVAKAMLTHASRSGGLRGKLAYMSPEQAQGLQVDYRTDLYSLGLVLYEIATGDRYFSGESQAELFGAVTHARQPQLESIDRALAVVIERLLTPAAEGRYSDAEEAIEALPSWVEVGPAGALELSRLCACLDIRVRLPGRGEALEDLPASELERPTVTEPEPFGLLPTEVGPSASVSSEWSYSGPSEESFVGEGGTAALEGRSDRPLERPVVPGARDAVTATREDVVALAIEMAPTGRYQPEALVSEDTLARPTQVHRRSTPQPRGPTLRRLIVGVVIGAVVLALLVIAGGVMASFLLGDGVSPSPPPAPLGVDGSVPSSAQGPGGAQEQAGVRPGASALSASGGVRTAPTGDGAPPRPARPPVTRTETTSGRVGSGPPRPSLGP